MLGEVIYQTANSRPTLAIRHAPEKNFTSYARISHVYSLVSIDTLTQTLKMFVAYFSNARLLKALVTHV